MTYFSTSVVLLNKDVDSLTVYVDYCCLIKLSLWSFMLTIVVWKAVGSSCSQMMSDNDVESFDYLCRQVWFEKMSTVHVAKYCLIMMSTLWLFMSTSVVWKPVDCSCRQMSDNDFDSFVCLCDLKSCRTFYVAKWCLIKMSNLLTVYVDKFGLKNCRLFMSPNVVW